MRWTIVALAAMTAALPGQRVTDYQFDVTTFGGQRITQEEFKDSVLLVDYWATWCGPCVKATPVLQELYAKYKHYGLEIVGLTYERGDPSGHAEKVRKFAIRQGLTYHLAPGTEALKKQVPGFRGFPTLLFFRPGLDCRSVEVGTSPGWDVELERRIQRELGITPEPAEGEAGAKQPVADVPEPLPPGVIHQPGDGDVGFAFEATDIDGSAFKFEDLRGKRVLLAVTSTWDKEAIGTAQMLQRLSRDHEGVTVLGGYLEISRDENVKLEKIRAFRKSHGLGYRLFPIGLAFQKKIHRFAAMPVFLVFDGEGRLTLRQSGVSEATESALNDHLKADG